MQVSGDGDGALAITNFEILTYAGEPPLLHSRVGKVIRFGNAATEKPGVLTRFRPKMEVASRCSRLALSRRLNFCNCYCPGTGDGEP